MNALFTGCLRNCSSCGRLKTGCADHAARAPPLSSKCSRYSTCRSSRSPVSDITSPPSNPTAIRRRPTPPSRARFSILFGIGAILCQPDAKHSSNEGTHSSVPAFFLGSWGKTSGLGISKVLRCRRNYWRYSAC